MSLSRPHWNTGKFRSLAPTSHLAEPRGVFTTLYYRGELRGCVGFVFPMGSLYRTVAESARGAAFDDSRFPPVTREQVAGIAKSRSASYPGQSRSRRKRWKLAVTAYWSAWAHIEDYCCRKCRWSTDGIALRSWNRPARKPACHRMHGKQALSWKPSPRKSSVTAICGCRDVASLRLPALPAPSLLCHPDRS